LVLLILHCSLLSTQNINGINVPYFLEILLYFIIPNLHTLMSLFPQAVGIPFPLIFVVEARGHFTHITSPLLNFHEHPSLVHLHVANVLTFTGMFNLYQGCPDYFLVRNFQK